MMQIQAQPFTSEADYLRQAKERRARLWAPRRVKRVTVAPAQPAPVFATKRAPSWEWTDTLFDDHVTKYRQWCFDQIAPVKAYIKRRAVELGFTYDHIIGPDRKRPAVRARQLIMWELKTKVKPSISYPELGRAFGGRDHTTCLHSVRRCEELMREGTDD